MEKIKIASQKHEKCLENFAFEYQAIKMYADGILNLIQKEI